MVHVALVVVASITLLVGVAINNTSSLSTFNSEIPTHKESPKQEVLSETSDPLVYPNSEIVIRTSDEVTLISTDNPAEITNWYKQEIKNMGFNTKSFVQTNTNNTVKNILKASSNDLTLTVEVSRPDDSSKTEIVVSY